MQRHPSFRAYTLFIHIKFPGIGPRALYCLIAKLAYLTSSTTILYSSQCLLALSSTWSFHSSYQ